MNSAIIVFPGSNCDRDAQTALREATGKEPLMIWHKEDPLPAGIDLIMVPGGFSYGDYLRCGAIAGNSPIISQLKQHAERGGYVLGVCNGFQILCETGLLPGALIRNAGLNFVCRPETLSVANQGCAFTGNYQAQQQISIPVAHHDGNFVADNNTLAQLEGDNRIAFKYVNNPNGSAHDIAGILSPNKRVLGMMPHPERAICRHEGGTDGQALFQSVLNAI